MDEEEIRRSGVRSQLIVLRGGNVTKYSSML